MMKTKFARFSMYNKTLERQTNRQTHTHTQRERERRKGEGERRNRKALNANGGVAILRPKYELARFTMHIQAGPGR